MRQVWDSYNATEAMPLTIPLVFRSFPGAALVRGPRGHAGDVRFVDLGA